MKVSSFYILLCHIDMSLCVTFMESTGTVGIGIFKLSNWTEIGSHNCKRNSGSLDSLWDVEIWYQWYGSKTGLK